MSAEQLNQYEYRTEGKGHKDVLVYEGRDVTGTMITVWMSPHDV